MSRGTLKQTNNKTATFRPIEHVVGNVSTGLERFVARLLALDLNGSIQAINAEAHTRCNRATISSEFVIILRGG